MEIENSSSSASSIRFTAENSETSSSKQHSASNNGESTLSSASGSSSSSCITNFFKAIWNFLQNLFCCRCNSSKSKTEEEDEENALPRQPETSMLTQMLSTLYSKDIIWMETWPKKLYIRFTVNDCSNLLTRSAPTGSLRTAYFLNSFEDFISGISAQTPIKLKVTMCLIQFCPDKTVDAAIAHSVVNTHKGSPLPALTDSPVKTSHLPIQSAEQRQSLVALIGDHLKATLKSSLFFDSVGSSTYWRGN